MALSRWQATIQDEAGNVVAGAVVTVRRESDGALAALFSDRDGMTGASNPLPAAGADGFVYFHAAGGAYRIDAELGAFSRTWRYVPMGTATEADYDDLVDAVSNSVEEALSSAKVISRTFSGTTDTLVLTDAGKMIRSTGASAAAMTVPPNSSVAFDVDTRIDFSQYGAGQVTVTPGAGVTLRAAGGALKTRSQYSGGSLHKIATDEWMVFGDLAT